MRFFFADVESTGLRQPAKIVEVCIVEADGDFNILNTWESRIDPEMAIEPGASGVHGLTNAMLVDEPTIEQFMEMNNHPLRTDGVLIAHNCQYDSKFLGPYFESYEPLCTLKCARILYPEAPDHKLQTLRFFLELEADHSKAHTAGEDVSLLMQLAKRMCHDHDLTLEGLMAVQNKKRKIERMPFGKHKGDLLKDIPKSYVSWMLKNTTNLDADLRAALEAL